MRSKEVEAENRAAPCPYTGNTCNPPGGAVPGGEKPNQKNIHTYIHTYIQAPWEN